MQHQAIPEDIKNDSNRCITGRFIWLEGMLFFKPDKDGQSLHDHPLRLPNESHSGLNVHLAQMWFLPAEDVVSFAPEWLEGYEALWVIRPEAVSVEIPENPITQAFRFLSGYLAGLASLKEKSQLKDSPTQGE